ncbi:MAG: glycosyltransferase, partial [Chthonomonadales bacterium]
MSPQEHLKTAIYGPFHHHVLSGPFNGMRYVDYSVGSSLYPKLLGTYEKELQQWLEAQRTNSNLNTIVNIGSGEGYYAVGAAMWLPGAKAFAFDTNALAQSTCLQLAHLNGVVERLYMYGEASGALVNPLLTETSLLIVDIEGAEYDLISSLDQDRLKSTRLMIELHDFVSMEETDRLLTSLRSTHTVELAYSQQRTPKDFDDSLRVGLAERDPAQLDQFLSSIPDGLKMQWLDEQRPGQMRWALCTPIPAKSQRARTTTSKSKSSLTRVQLAGNSESIITGCILAQNEEKRIEGAIRCLLPWVSEVLVIDDSSTDCTAEIAASLGARVISAASETNFDGARNLAKEYATTEYIFFLDADERVHPALAAILTQLVTHREGDFDALIIPFKNYFCGKWIEHCGWWPGYTRPQLLKREKFTYRSRLHSGVEVDGKTLSFPSHQHELAISHFSYDDLDAYVTKMNRYTCGEADNLDLDNLSHHWKAQIAHFMVDWQWYYDLKEAPKDGTHGFVLAFMAACYRFISRAKLWDKRRKDGLDTGSDEVPSSMAEILSFMREIAINGPGEWLQITTLPTEAVIATASSLSDAPVFAKKSGKTSAKMPTVTGCILAKNEESQIADAILSLTGWCKEVIVLDNESTDRTAEISKSLGAKVISVPVSDDFDGLRNMVVEHASGEWIYYLDADERVPASLVPVIKDFLKTDSSDYVAAKFPFRTKIFGKWMESPVRWPGYSREQLLKKGSFHYNHLLHGVIQVDGEVKKFEAESVDQAVVHYAFDDITHYISKANGYTSREGSIQVSLDRPHTWDVQLTVFVREWNLHYDTLQAYQDGMHGFVFSFLSAFYRYLTVAKPWDHRRKLGYIDDATNMPTTVLDMVNFMARAIGIEFGHSPIQPAPQNHVPELASSRGSTNVKNIVVVGPALASGEFGDDCRDICTSLTLLDPAFGLIAVPWNTGNIELGSSNQFALESNVVAPNQLAGIAVVDLPILQQRHLSTAEITIARTWFETDRLDSSAVELLSQVDRIWVASKFNLNTFANSGVPQAKIAVIPPTIEPEYLRTPDVTSAIRNGPFRFISFVDWGLYKGWDILVDAFVTAFKSTSDIELKIVILDLDGSTLQSAEAEIDVHLRRNYSKGLIDCENIKLECAGRSHTAREAQLTDADAYIQPSRGEGSCRDLLRAMAVGLPVVSPAWGAFEDILNSDVGYPLNFELIPVDNELASKYPHFEGHNCIKPDTKHLQSIMRILSKRPASAQQKVRRAQKLVVERFSRQAVLPFIEAEIALCQQLRSAKKPVVPHDPPIASKPEIVVHDALLV